MKIKPVCLYCCFFLAKDCLNRMMRVNPAHRITCSELFDHAWFQDKKLHETHDKQKNVLELMSEMLQEQENRKFFLQSTSVKESKINDEIENTENGEKTSSSNSRHQTLTHKSSNMKLYPPRTNSDKTHHERVSFLILFFNIIQI